MDTMDSPMRNGRVSEPGTASSRADSHGRYDEYSEMGESDILGEYFQFDLIPEFRLKLQGAVRALRGSLNWVHKPTIGTHQGYSWPEIVLKPAKGAPLETWVERLVVRPQQGRLAIQSGVVKLGSAASCQMHVGYNLRSQRPFFGYEIRLMGDIQRRKGTSNFEMPFRKAKSVKGCQITVKTGIKMDWDVPTMSGGMDEEGHVQNHQDWGMIAVTAPRFDVKVRPFGGGGGGGGKDAGGTEGGSGGSDASVQLS